MGVLHTCHMFYPWWCVQESEHHTEVLFISFPLSLQSVEWAVQNILGEKGVFYCVLLKMEGSLQR
jgi:hypothetical protein